MEEIEILAERRFQKKLRNEETDGEKFDRLKKIIARAPIKIKQQMEVKNKIEQT